MSGINIRTKGAGGEREVATILNNIIKKVLLEFTKDPIHLDNHNYYVQRNQNQTAVGGNDLVNTYGYGIEIKRHETLSVNTWWRQTIAAATKNGEIPVLIYRQNSKKWKCITEGYLSLPKSQFGACRVEVGFDTFLKAFECHVRNKLKG